MRSKSPTLAPTAIGAIGANGAFAAIAGAAYAGDLLSPISGARIPRHVAIIMDGNGRWAKARGLPRAAGHRAGTENIRRIIERFSAHGVTHVTLYAFSTENWNRPKLEVQALMRLLSRFIKRETDNFVAKGVQLRLLGHLESLPAGLQKEVTQAIDRTRENKKLQLNLCFSYGGRDDIVMAVRKIVADGVSPDEVDEAMVSAKLYTHDAPDPDLVIRTAGDLRISNFLLWQAAYAELYFTNTLWPDFGREDIDAALADYGCRKRKFGALLPEDAESLQTG